MKKLIYLILIMAIAMFFSSCQITNSYNDIGPRINILSSNSSIRSSNCDNSIISSSSPISDISKTTLSSNVLSNSNESKKISASASSEISANSNSDAVREANEYKGSYSKICRIMGTEWPIKSIKELIDRSDIVIKVMFYKDEGVFNTSKMLMEKGYTDVGIDSVYTFYKMEIVEVYMGDVNKGDEIEIRIMGGIYEDTLYFLSDTEALTDEFDYILFLTDKDYIEMPYHVTHYSKGLLPIKDNKLSLNNRTIHRSFFENNEPIEQIIAKIKENID